MGEGTRTPTGLDHNQELPPDRAVHAWYRARPAPHPPYRVRSARRRQRRRALVRPLRLDGQLSSRRRRGPLLRPRSDAAPGIGDRNRW